MIYEYTAYDSLGKESLGTLEAANKESASFFLYKKGLMVVALKPLKSEKGGSVNKKDLIVLTRVISNGVSARLPLTRVLEIASEEFSKKGALRGVLVDVLHQIKVGKNFSDALASHPKLFSRFYVNMVRAGEKSGKLDYSFDQILNYLLKRQEMSRKVSSALLYPSMILAFSFVVLGFFMGVLIPKFEMTYSQFGSQLPKMTRSLIDFTKWFQGHFVFIGLGILLLIGGLFAFWKTKPGRLFFERVLFAIPIIGGLINKDVLAILTNTLSVLLKNGVTLTDALGLSKGVLTNLTYERMVQKAILDISGGKKLAESFKTNPHVPAAMMQMTAMGEETGRLPELFYSISQYYEGDVDTSVDQITTVITPILIIFIGLMIGFIMVALYLPMFNIGQSM